MRKRPLIVIVAFVALAGIAYAANGPTPSVGLYWLDNTDPTVGVGMAAPTNQLLIRTDAPSIYYKSGAANTAWTQVGISPAGGGGTVTSVACGTGLSCAPNPIVAAGSVAVNLTPTTCSAGQAATAIAANGTATCSAFDSGTGTVNRVTKWSSTSGGLTDTQFPIDDTSTTALALGDSQSADVLTMSGRAILNSTFAANHTFDVERTLSASTTTAKAGAEINVTGTVDTTATDIDVYGLRSEVSTTKSAGANGHINYGILANVSGGSNGNVGIRSIVSGANGSTDTRGIQVENTSTVQTAYGVHVLVSGAVTGTNYGIKVGAVNGVNNRAFEASDGDVFLNTQSGKTQINGNTTILGSTLTIGLGGTANTNVIEKHDTTPSLGADCQTGGSQTIVGSDFAMVVTAGATATACTITFQSAFQNAPTCVVTARTGANQATLVYTTSASKLTMSVVTAAAIYDAMCVGH